MYSCFDIALMALFCTAFRRNSVSYLRFSFLSRVMFNNFWNKVVAFQLFTVGFILFLFSDYCWEIIYSLIYVTKLCLRRWSRRSFVWRHITKLSLSRLLRARYRRKLEFNKFPDKSQIVIGGPDRKEPVALRSSQAPWTSKFLTNLNIWFLSGNLLKLNFLLYLAWIILKCLVS